MAVKHARFISSEVQKTLLKISQLVVQEESLDETVSELQGLCEPSPVPEGAWSGFQGAFFIPQPAVRWYGDGLVRKLLSWFWFAVDLAAEVKWISQFQLYVDFMISTGEVGPVHFDKWLDGVDFPMTALINLSFKVRCRWFSKVLKECLRHQHQEVAYAYCRPFSEALSLHTGCLAVPWAQHRIARIDQWILTHVPAGDNYLQVLTQG
eukprot:s827_g4.t1